jgi:nucleotide-binding universal stress UspA family protein
VDETSPPPVVVAVGGDGVGRAALAFAVDEAVRAGCGVHLLHVAPAFVHGPDSILVTSPEVQERGRRVLNEALEVARQVVPGTTALTSDLGVGPVVESLREATRGARMVVVEHRDLSRVHRLVSRSVTNGLGAHLRVPVVGVPAAWRPGRGPDHTPRVTVGVDVPVRSERVLRTAVAEAAGRGASLHALHAWRLTGMYDGGVSTQEQVQDLAQRAADEIRHALAVAGVDALDVEATVETRRGSPAEALVEASGASDLLVVGRHDPLVPLGSHLGPVARGVLHEARCPVLLVDPHDPPGADEADGGDHRRGRVET